MDNPLIALVICWLVPVLTAGGIGYAIGRGYRLKISMEDQK